INVFRFLFWSNGLSGCDNISVIGHIGQEVSLRCRYNIKYYNASDISWGRGELPNRGCSNQLIGTGEYKEETRASSRYQLLGRLDEGDVSLTIQNLREEDAGRYGCRVGIPGWFNDLKHYVDLTFERGEKILIFNFQNQFLKHWTELGLKQIKMAAPVTFRKLCLVIIVILRCLRRVRRRRQHLVNLLDRVGFWDVDKTNERLFRIYRCRKQRQTLKFITLLSRIITGNRVAW
uniref:Ig-like domain-containing protein n=1 Tax=Fundulus heteroclitus TaxID=8078 RepID=A0A3Q2Q4A9_FUNHE